MVTRALNYGRYKFLELLDGFSYHLILLFAASCVLFLLVLVKSRTLAQFALDPVLLGYTIFVTTFQLSRMISAAFYRTTYNRLVGLPGDAAAGSQPDDYEPTVSFVIPCMNEEAAIAKTITQCYLTEYPKHKMEVIVINDGSTDNTLAEIMRMKKQYPELTVVNWKKNQGKRHGMVEGFKRSTGEIIIQLDSDSFFDPVTFRHVLTPFRNPNIGGVCAHAEPSNADVNILTRMQAAYYYMSFRILKAAESTYYSVLCLSGCSSAYRREAVVPILDEWLKESFWGQPATWGDDRSLTSWVLKQGYSTIYTDYARAFTIVPETFKQFIKQQIRWKKSWLVNTVFTLKFIIKKDPFIAFAYFIPLTLATIMTPFMAARALLYIPIAQDPATTIFYITGIMLITALVCIYYRFLSRENKYWPYLFIWSALNAVCLSMLLFYALATIQNRKWGTR